MPTRRRANLRGSITRRDVVALGLVGGVGLLMASFTIGIGRDPTIIDSPLIGHQAPGLVGPTLDGRSFDLASLNGKVAIVNFWASCCLQCRLEHPDFVLAAERYRGAPVAFVGVVFQPETDLVNASGVIRDKVIGPVDFAHLTTWIDPLLGSPSGPP